MPPLLQQLTKLGQELGQFILKELRACIFPGGLIALTLIGQNIANIGLAYYDFLFIASASYLLILVFAQIISLDELKVMLIFALLGLGMECFKTHPQVHYWTYPQAAYTKLATVPLYIAFMHASVASYIVQAWRLLQLKLINYQANWTKWLLAIAIYLNFFSKHYVLDLKIPLILITIFSYWPTQVQFKLKKYYQMPLLVAFLLIGLFLWLAENIVTFFGAWQYHYQIKAWSLVKPDKVIAWFLFFIVAFILVSQLKVIKRRKS